MTIQTTIEHFTIREVAEQDVPLVLSLIRELAEYEGLLDEVVATEEALRASLFGDGRVVEGIIGEWSGNPVAYALYFRNFSSFVGRPGMHLEDLYVKPEVRGCGIGKVMLAYLASVARKRQCARMEWWVLDWNEPARDFYGSIGAVSMDGWIVQRMTGDSLEELAAPFERV